jgi:uncharacterized protein (TIGR02271 family)
VAQSDAADEALVPGVTLRGLDGVVATLGDPAIVGDKLSLRFEGMPRVLADASLVCPQLLADGSYQCAIDFAPLRRADADRPTNTTIPVLEEVVEVAAKEIETGRVRVQKYIEQYEREIDEVGWAEQIEIEKVPVNRILDTDQTPGARFEDGTLVVPLLEETLVLQKKILLKEELRITRVRHDVRHRQRIPLRREQVSVERLPASKNWFPGEAAHDNSGGERAGAAFRHRRDTMATVVAVFDNYSEAEQARTDLVESGVPERDVNITANEATGAQLSHLDTGDEAHLGFGERIAHFFRSLFGSDDDEDHTAHYAEAVRRGSCVLTAVVDDSRVERVSEILREHDAVDINDRAQQWRAKGWTGYEPNAAPLTDEDLTQEREYNAARVESQTVPVVEEELKVGKREVQRGTVRVFTRVTETPVQEQVQLREEHATIERRPVDRPATEADLAAFKEGSIEVRETAEEPVTSKTTRVVEEVVVGKEATERTETINDVVRRTDVEVEQGRETSERAQAVPPRTERRPS